MLILYTGKTNKNFQDYKTAEEEEEEEVVNGDKIWKKDKKKKMWSNKIQKSVFIASVLLMNFLYLNMMRVRVE